jgi:hypothetical protein
MKLAALFAVVACSAPPTRLHDVEPPSETIRERAPEPDESKPTRSVLGKRKELRSSISLEVLGLEGRSATGGYTERSVNMANTMTKMLRSSARQYESIHVGHASKEMIDEQLMFNCEHAEPACMAPIGEQYNVDHLLYGTLDERGVALHVRLVLLDVKTQRRDEWTGTVRTVPDMETAAVAALATFVDRIR